MAGRTTTRLQVSGYRFLARRMQHALVRADVRMLDDPLRAQHLALVAGAVLAAVAIVACAVLAAIRPAGGLADARIVVVPDSGALYVTVDGVLHPVPNLASARLVTGVTEAPRVVSQRAVDAAPRRGPRIGIPGAPQRLSPPLDAQDAAWTVCDDAAGITTVMVGGLGSGVTPGRAVLVTPQGSGPSVTYLLSGGWRSRVDLRHPAVVRALRIDGVVPRPVSAALLAAVPEAPAIEPPRVPGRGEPGPGRLHRYPVGTVVATRRIDGATEHFAVLRDGVQKIGDVAADLLRFTDARVGADVPVVAPETIGGVPAVESLPVTTFPDRSGVDELPVLCARWQVEAFGSASHSQVLSGAALPSTAPVVALGRADADGPAVDGVAVPPGRSVFARSVGLTGSGASSGSLFLVDDSGVRYGIDDDDTAARLGLGSSAVAAPWPVLAGLPGGPELSVRAASVVRDGVDAP